MKGEHVTARTWLKSHRWANALTVSVVTLSGIGCDVTGPDVEDELSVNTALAEQILDRYITFTDDSELRVVLLEGSPFAAVEAFFSQAYADIYEQFGATEPFRSGYVEALRDLGLDEGEINDFLGPDRRAAQLGADALRATGHTLVDLGDPTFFSMWASALSANDTWTIREEELGYRFAGLQIGAPVELVNRSWVLVPFTTLCGQGCGSGHVAVFSRGPLGVHVLREVRTAWVGYL